MDSSWLAYRILAKRLETGDTANLSLPTHLLKMTKSLYFMSIVSIYS